MIKAAQRGLCDAGFPCRVDGNFDSNMTNAVAAYQQANSLEPNGIIDQDLYDVLTGATPPRSAPPKAEPAKKPAAKKASAKKAAPKKAAAKKTAKKK